MKMHSQKGFTLLEVLLAVGITALIGVGASQLLSITANTKNELSARSDNLRALQRVDLLVSRDLMQIIGRETKDEYGALQPAVITTDDWLIQFTRSGLGLPISMSKPPQTIKRSSLQRVAYAIKDHSDPYCQDAIDNLKEGRCFVRLFWPVLDFSSDTQPFIQVLLDDIDDVQFLFTGQVLDPSDPSNNTIIENEPTWPPSLLAQGMIADLVQIKVRYTNQSIGEFDRIYEVPRYAFSK